jgi:tRNA1Val (adenine37-N6)-methyltransferase
MSNSWFQFKKFIIRQDKTAMKVGTDGVLLGAWSRVQECSRILDVGTGTGLIALMMAQRTKASIDAIEIDPEAAKQACENVIESPWNERINVMCTSLQDFYQASAKKYDLVVCNPPYFKDSLKAGTPSRSIARHSDQLELTELVSCSKILLNTQGRLSVILPADKEPEMISIAKDYDLFPSKILRVRPIPGKEHKRVLMEFSFLRTELQESEMNLETGLRHQYSPEYITLTLEYYL